jgi:hypothetical protein
MTNIDSIRRQAVAAWYGSVIAVGSFTAYLLIGIFDSPRAAAIPTLTGMWGVLALVNVMCALKNHKLQAEQTEA